MAAHILPDLLTLLGGITGLPLAMTLDYCWGLLQESRLGSPSAVSAGVMRCKMKPFEMSISENKSFMGDMRNDDLATNDGDEEERAFIAGLYQFMKERKTPIDRLPHLGFKQSKSAEI
ncbi:hypothetical protein NDU88_005066 [Pleurodeles waltl]|uniref:Uncharacterized protein n=1 Tax=Pleurodeles waltl TaxID=8319 RepID=A0AAV7LNI2_PLEWA|nr:hypothetical protein NDU88_005066 [Pleurodeles waltl]